MSSLPWICCTEPIIKAWYKTSQQAAAKLNEKFKSYTSKVLSARGWPHKERGGVKKHFTSEATSGILIWETQATPKAIPISARMTQLTKKPQQHRSKDRLDWDRVDLFPGPILQYS